MSDARWFEIDADITAAAEHFSRAVELFARGGFDDATLDGYGARMALMHAMQSGHTSLETGLVRVLILLGEEPPTGLDWHADLIRRVARPLAERPAVLSSVAAKVADETRRFCNVAMRSYGAFDIERARPAVLAAGTLAATIAAEIAAFRRPIDPPAP